MSELEKQFQPLLNECDKLRILILDPQPGLATWHMMIRDRLIGMHKELNDLLPMESRTDPLGKWKGDRLRSWSVMMCSDHSVFKCGFKNEDEAEDYCDSLNKDEGIPHEFYVVEVTQ